jgi:urease accessory protein UreF
VEFDGEVGRELALRPFFAASRRVGQAQIRRLRPLRDHRFVQRYLRSVESGLAQGWHTLVYGITLSVYSLPVLQGLVSYERQTLLGFIHAVSRALHLSEADCRGLIDQLSPTLPRTVEPILGDGTDPRHPSSF